MQHSPLEQFLVKTLVPMQVGGVDISLTNAGLTMVCVTAVIMAFLHKGTADINNPVPSRTQVLMESCYDFVLGILRDSVGKKNMVPFIPYIFSLFVFVLFANLFGMLPFSFTVTSHIAVTFTIAIAFFVVITIIGFMRHGLHYFRLFLPHGVPLALAPLIIPIELVAYLVRPITLSMRLFLNMTAGHIMLKVFAGFSVMVGAVFGLLPALVNVLLVGFEFFVAGLQAFIFTLLICIYLNDAVNMH